MASGTSPVKAWPYPLATDTPSVHTDIQALTTALDVVPKAKQGILSSRPSSGMTTGDTYVVAGDSTAANNGIEWYYNGTAWVVLEPTWVPLTLSTNILAGSGPTPSARIEGDIVRLKGDPVNNTGGNLAAGSGFFATLPVSGMIPSPVIAFLATGTSIQIQIDAGGRLSPANGNSIVNGVGVHLNSVTFPLS